MNLGKKEEKKFDARQRRGEREGGGKRNGEKCDA